MNRQGAISIGARRCDEAIGHFLLQHQRRIPQHPPIVGVVEQLEQDWGGDVVGKVADHAYGLLGIAEQIGEIDVEEIRANEFDVRDSRGKSCREIAIDLDGEEALHSGGQRHGQRAAARSDLEERLVWACVESVNELCDPGRLQKMLAESLASQSRAPPKGAQSSSSGPSVSPRQ